MVTIIPTTTAKGSTVGQSSRARPARLPLSAQPSQTVRSGGKAPPRLPYPAPAKKTASRRGRRLPKQSTFSPPSNRGVPTGALRPLSRPIPASAPRCRPRRRRERAVGREGGGRAALQSEPPAVGTPEEGEAGTCGSAGCFIATRKPTWCICSVAASTASATWSSAIVRSPAGRSGPSRPKGRRRRRAGAGRAARS